MTSSVPQVARPAVRVPSRRIGVLVPVAVVLIWLLCLPRMVPTLVLDRGIFVSVAERLLAGDVLYRGVWDNKDPLFYYVVAIGRLVSPFGDVLLEAVWVLLAGIGMWRLARWLGCTPPWGVLVGFGLTPIVVTGGLYEAGYSHLPGSAVGVLAIAAIASRRYVAGGALVGVLCFLKLVMLPVVGVPVAIIVLARRDLRRVPAAALGFVAVVAAVVLLLLVRGELGPYVAAQVLNLTYSQSSLLPAGVNPLIGHLLRVASTDAIITVVATIAVIVWAAFDTRSDRAQGEIGGRRLVLLATVGAFIAAVAVLAVTGLWPQHQQILLVPALLAALLIVSRIWRITDLRAVGAVPVAVLVAAIAVGALPGSPAPIGYLKSATAAPRLLGALAATPPEATALLAEARSGTYARVGQNDDLGHAFGLRDWKLACGRFHQYPFDPAQVLEQTVACLPRARYIIVSASAAPVRGATAWNHYLTQVGDLLAAEYACTAHGDTRICVRSTQG